MKRKLAWALGLTAVAVTLVVFAPLVPLVWDYFAPSVVTVDNRSPAELRDIQVKMSGRTIWSGILMPGAAHQIWARPHGDGIVDISFSANGRPQSRPLGYVTNGIRERHEIVVGPTLEVGYTMEPIDKRSATSGE
ncbi:MAG TPA: hypothetical protein VH722_04805 [Alphaproteobacteria bacterium]|nr:hypothetical protein [Alphaproteobacteria bacterium]